MSQFTPPSITGYRSLPKADVDLINTVKQHAEETRALLGLVDEHLRQQPKGAVHGGVETNPQRWLAEARTDLQKGYMSLVRAIAQPTTF